MRSSQLEPNVISYNSAISACSKGQQWEQALNLLSEMRSSWLQPDVISYHSAISACDKGRQWEQALRLLLEMRSSRLEPNVMSYNSAISACDKGQQWEQALIFVARDAELPARAERDQLQLRDQRLREGPEVGAGFELVAKDGRALEAQPPPTR